MPIKIPKKPLYNADLFIDRIVVVVHFPNDASAQMIHENIMEALSTSYMKNGFFMGSKKPTATKVFRHIILPDLKEKHYPYMEYRFGGGKATSMRLTLHPRDMGMSGFDRLHDKLKELFSEGWNFFIKKGKITLIEVGADFPGVDFKNVHMMPMGKRIYKEFQSGGGKVETIYLGSSRDNQFKAYDRGKKREKQGDEALSGTCTRVERVRKYTSRPFSTLSDLGNQFTELEFSNLPSKPPPQESKAYIWSLFIDSATFMGLPRALKLLPPNKLKIYMSYLQKQPPNWWKPDDLWKKWPNFLQKTGIITLRP